MLPYLSILPLLEEISDPEDRVKFHLLFEKYERIMFKAAKEILENDADAEDAEYNAWAKIVKCIHDIDMNQNPKGYLITAEKNEAKTIYRRKQKEGVFDPAYVDDEPDPGPSIPDQVEDKAGVRSMINCIKNLPETYREVMTMRFVSHLTVKQIAVISGLNENTVKSRIRNGKLLIAKELQKLGYRVCLTKK